MSPVRINLKTRRQERLKKMSGQWQPYKQENEIEQESTEVGQSLDTEEDDSETDTKHDSRFRRRID
jgi:hypothetical protein